MPAVAIRSTSINDGPPPDREALDGRLRHQVHGIGVVAVDQRRLETVRHRLLGGGWRTAVTLLIAVYSMYRLFSHTKMTGSWYTAAKLSASVKGADVGGAVAEEGHGHLIAPRSRADHAAPLAMHRWAPTIAQLPIIPCSTLVRASNRPCRRAGRCHVRASRR